MENTPSTDNVKLFSTYRFRQVEVVWLGEHFAVIRTARGERTVRRSALKGYVIEVTGGGAAIDGLLEWMAGEYGAALAAKSG